MANKTRYWKTETFLKKFCTYSPRFIELAQRIARRCGYKGNISQINEVTKNIYDKNEKINAADKNGECIGMYWKAEE
ncbi:MAG: hypothetical protein IJI51_08680 [Lachnospiraceae bacterium]|nr:hypothetical protein [Lachnospiraceae bacterium]